jgi:Zn-dependent M28 family amino/carboxypeptidase
MANTLSLHDALPIWEEQGLLGSDVYAARSKTGNENIRGYLNLDMLGYNGTGSLSPRVVNLFWKSTGPASQQIADTFISVNSTYGLTLIPFKYDAVSYTIGNQSDNSSFWNRGYPAIMAIEDYYGDFTPYYHTKNDLYSTLDLDYFTSMVKAAVGTFAHLPPEVEVNTFPIHRKIWESTLDKQEARSYQRAPRDSGGTAPATAPNRTCRLHSKSPGNRKKSCRA